MSDTEHDGAAEIGGSGGGGGAAAGGAGGPAKALSPAVEGVLLYYGYRDLRSCRGEVAAWIEALSTQLGLVGRIRVALDGLNATLGGTLGALRTHAAAVEARFGSAKQGPAIDFKLAASHGRASAAAAAGSAFDRLTVQQVTEVVSLGVLDWLPQPRREDDGSGTCSSCDVSGDVAGLLPAGARHVEPAEFHALLAAAAADAGQPGGKAPVLIDARNLYETAIGRFKAPAVEPMDPRVRCFSDTPQWLEANQHRLAGRPILMCCTGGVRCERASAYVKSLGPSFQDVVQLKGGIQRYLEAFPDGGFFKGQLFVFDERGAVGGGDEVVGRCASCATPCSHYLHRWRCADCRMLLLVCDGCDGATHSSAGKPVAPPGANPAGLRCDLCQQRQVEAGAATTTASGGRRLRILCLHGFRQTARSFEGRTHALRRRLKDLAEFVFVDAPHALPAWSKAPGDDAPAGAEAASAGRQAHDSMAAAAAAGAAERQQEEQQQAGDVRAVAAELDAELAALVAQQQLLAEEEAASPDGTQQRQHSPCKQLQQQRRGMPRRCAWLLTPEQHAAQHEEQRAGTCQDDVPAGTAAAAAAAAWVDDTQFQRQAAGWAESEQELQRVLREQGPFDGVLGFSQGAAVAAVLAVQHARQQQQQEQHPPGGIGGNGACEGSVGAGALRFAIMCSGYRSPLPAHAALLDAAAAAGGAPIPTLHIYGAGSADRQISGQESAALAECFDPTQRFVVRHAGGHLIPSCKSVVARLLAFLQRCQREDVRARAAGVAC
ncbi:rhodanese-like domain-containing 6 isoform X1 [Micractinium conductrix]|uniref:Rhodanese-like domain-containing 6 isoform X1 n=1 Tax=Micractinium conductrix TaxID=554055 RepID=A0A2P6V8K0_9CHLO|nr:rhodanese-like domain-containing 6 isoform X1 [Micractinium conductrix]|eukprot:PSC70407.1 rhodanese-like domain-containing 6 isoform X1 [Micractinium conductrix]